MKARAGNDLAEMPFTAHLAELRNRIVKSLIGITIAALIAYHWVEPLFHLLTEPIRGSFGKLELIGTGPTDAFLCKMKVAIAAGIVLSTPYSFYQLWLFIAPGLLPRERKFALPFVFGSTLSFLLGVFFCYVVVLPFAFKFFSEEFLSIDVQPAIKIDEYFGFVVKLSLVFGAVFELPMFSYFLARFGILKYRFLVGWVRHFVVGIFIVAAILSPPDVVSQMCLALPLLVIYGICIAITYFAEKDKLEKKSETDGDIDPLTPRPLPPDSRSQPRSS